MRDVDLVIEAVIDDLQIKQDLFERESCSSTSNTFTALTEAYNYHSQVFSQGINFPVCL